MQPLTYESIAPLITDQRAHHRSVEYTFRCPITGAELRSSATLPPPSELPALAAQLGRSSLLRAVRDALFHTITQIFGYGFFGRFLGELARGAVENVRRERGDLSRDELERAAVLAFERVARHFIWDPGGRRWIGREAAGELLSDFERALADAPLEHPYDREVLARMLAEVARADGRLSGEEVGWLTQYIAASEGSIEGLGARPPLTAAELGEVSGAARSSLLMLAWAVALADEEPAEAERVLLQRFADGLGLSPEQRGLAASRAGLCAGAGPGSHGHLGRTRPPRPRRAERHGRASRRRSRRGRAHRGPLPAAAGRPPRPELTPLAGPPPRRSSQPPGYGRGALPPRTT